MIELTSKNCTYNNHPDLAGIEYIYSLSDQQGKYGEILFEVTPYFVLVHPRLFRCTKETFEELKKALFEVGHPLLIEKYGFTKVHFATTNHKLVHMLLDGQEKIEVEHLTPGRTLYYYEAV